MNDVFARELELAGRDIMSMGLLNELNAYHSETLRTKIGPFEAQSSFLSPTG